MKYTILAMKEEVPAGPAILGWMRQGIEQRGGWLALLEGGDSGGSGGGEERCIIVPLPHSTIRTVTPLSLTAGTVAVTVINHI